MKKSRQAVAFVLSKKDEEAHVALVIVRLRMWFSIIDLRQGEAPIRSTNRFVSATKKQASLWSNKQACWQFEKVPTCKIQEQVKSEIAKSKPAENHQPPKFKNT